MNKKTLFCLILVINACTSDLPRQDTQYFLLIPNLPTNSNSESVTLEDNPEIKILLQPIKIAEFLDQPGIVLQTDEHQIDVAHYHRWGEPLKRNLHRYILETLATQMPNYTFRNSSKFNTAANLKHLQITINQFNGTADGIALLSGNWRLIDSHSKTSTMQKSFSYREKLASEGYLALVKELAALLDHLCLDIANLIQAKS